MVMGEGVYHFDGREVLPLAKFDAPVESVAFAGVDQVSVRVDGETTQLPLAPLRANALEGPELADLNPQDGRALAANERRELYRAQQKAMLGADTFWFPSFRVSPGVAFPIGSRVPQDGPGDDSEAPDGDAAARGPHYAMDLAAGVLLAPPSGDKYLRGHGVRSIEAWFWPEIGYTWRPDAPGFEHAATAGLGFGVGNDFLAGYYKPRGVLGMRGLFGDDAMGEGGDQGMRRLFPGMRHGVSAQALWGAVGLEASHGMVFADGVHHDLRLSLDINLAPWVWAAILWGSL